ncbi:MAG: ROK family protein [Anaerolineales bacterium]|nr:ROK family protein [Anaerolineales bacterium]
MIFGGIEGGGTKFICAVGTAPNDICAETRIPTTTPEETLTNAITFFKEQQKQLGPLKAIGIANFGPLDVRLDSPTYGQVLPTPKPHWSGANLLGMLHNAFDIPIGFDNDVNASALAEHLWGAAQGLDTFIYLTVGTGIGAGVFTEGKLLHGLLHPEMGHIPLPHDLAQDPFEGTCPFHGDCFEGLACGPAMEKRWGQRAETLPDDHPAWKLEAQYLSQALTSFIYTISPQRIIIGGGVGSNLNLLKMVREQTQALINGYIPSQAILNEIDSYIVSPDLGNRAGVLGAIALAEEAWNQKQERPQ